MNSKENPFLSLIINILIPVLILNKGTVWLTSRFGDHGPWIALALALAFPLTYGLRDYIFNGHKNYVSMLGTLSTSLTGGFALFSLDGLWFAAKEATLPFCIGLFVILSAFTKRPFAKVFFLNPQLVRVDDLTAALRAKDNESEFERLLRVGTLFFAASFFFSSALNFLLGRHVFKKIDAHLTASAHTQILNEQIAHMTWLSFLVIAGPLVIFTALFMWWFFKKISQLSGIEFQDLMAKPNER